jgi:HEAT repeat protein
MGQTNGVNVRCAFGLVCAISTLWTVRASADPRVRVDAEKKTLIYAGGSVPIPIAQIGAGAVTTSDVSLGGGKTVTHVRVAAEPNPWEALVAGDSVVYSGLTGFLHGQPGGRTGDVVQLIARESGEKVVLVGEVREDVTICGQATTPLSPRVLDPRTMKLREATVQRLPLEQRTKATVVVASPRRGPAEKSLARLLGATAASSGVAKALTDGDPETVWTETRPGLGQGEFVTMDAPPEVPITRLAVTIAPSDPSDEGAAPQTFYLVAKDKTYAIKMPEDAWTHPGEAYDVPLPDPVSTPCLSLVLDAAYVRGKTPDVSVAELMAYGRFSGGNVSLQEVAKALKGGGALAEEAAAVLKRAAAPLPAVRAEYGGLDAPGRALAIDVARTAACADSAPLLTDALGDDDREVVRKARGKLEACAKAAAPALADGVRTGSPKVRMQAATLLAHVAPKEALAPLAEALGGGDGATRAAVRGALGHAAQTADKDTLSALLARPGGAGAKVEMLRALSARLGDLRAEADARIAELLAPGADMRTRFLLAGPLAELARAGDDAAAARLGALLAEDPHVAVRAHAAEVSGGIGALEARLTAAIDDPEPRVREAALRSIASARARAGEARAIARLESDGWTFVRAAAAGALAALPRSPAADRGLEIALRDPSARVRSAAIEGLAAHDAKSAAGALGARAFDEKEDAEVRLAAVRALGRTCAHAAVDDLTRLAKAGASQVADDDARSLAIAATDTLGRLHPSDLAARLAKVTGEGVNDAVKRAAQHALGATEVCR